MSDATSINSARDRRWLILGVIGLAQLMVILDLTVMNIALPSAQRALHFTIVERQWVVTAYTLAFGSLLPLGGRLADLLGRKVTFLTGLVGFAGVSAIGRHLRGDRRGRRRGGPADRRRADPIPLLAVDALREPDLRGGGVHWGSAAAEAAAVRG